MGIPDKNVTIMRGGRLITMTEDKAMETLTKMHDNDMYDKLAVFIQKRFEHKPSERDFRNAAIIIATYAGYLDEKRLTDIYSYWQKRTQDPQINRNTATSEFRTLLSNLEMKQPPAYILAAYHTMEEMNLRENMPIIRPREIPADNHEDYIIIDLGPAIHKMILTNYLTAYISKRVRRGNEGRFDLATQLVDMFMQVHVKQS